MTKSMNKFFNFPFLILKIGKREKKVEMSKIRFEQILEIWNEIKCQK